MLKLNKLKPSYYLFFLFMTLVMLQAHAQDVVPGEVIVKLKGKSSSTSVTRFLSKANSFHKMTLKTSFPRLNMHHYAFKDQGLQAKLEELRNDPDVEYVEPNYILHKSDDDPVGMLSEPMSREEVLAQSVAGGASAQTSTTPSFTQNGANVQVVSAWNASTPLSVNPEKPIVAVIDTGVDYNHSVFTESGAMWVNANETPNNGIDDDNNGYVDDYLGYNFINNTGNPMDDDGHGTHVSGIILGATTDIMASHVAEAKIRIMPLKFLGPDGAGSTSNAIRAIYYAVNMGAKVLNNSWGGGTYSQALNEAIAFSYQQKVVFVAAAGNSGQNSDVTPMYPADYDTPHIISVAATNDWDYLPTFSNYGKVSVDISSPGVSILSTLPNNSYGYSSGTSMAAPFVSGVAAMMVREAPDLTGYQIRDLIGQSSDKFSQLSSVTSYGGRVNAYSAVQYAKGGSTTLAYQPDYAVSASTSNRELASEISSGGAQGGCGLVSSVAAQYARGGGSGGGGGMPPLAVISALMLLPFIVWRIFKASQPEQRRKYERFVMKSQVKVMVGERELVGSINTISMGGASFSSEAMLEKGGLVTMKITAPDGAEQIEVQGRIVWSEENKAYGVQFADAKEGVLQSISNWTKSLVKAS